MFLTFLVGPRGPMQRARHVRDIKKRYRLFNCDLRA